MFIGCVDADWANDELDRKSTTGYLFRIFDKCTTEAIFICEDNIGCISIANNPTHHKRSKHIDIKYHFTRDLIQKGYISFKYLSTGNQFADIFTKSVIASKLMEIRFSIGLH